MASILAKGSAVSLDLHHRAVVADAHNDLLMAVGPRPPEHWGGLYRGRGRAPQRAGGGGKQG
ncbi:hypothetical protein ACFVZ2_40620, partial [Streptomyces lasiicapitis]